MYGCRGRLSTEARGTLLDDAARVHHGDAVAGLGGDAHVVRDDDLRHAKFVAKAEAAAGGSAPGW